MNHFQFQTKSIGKNTFTNAYLMLNEYSHSNHYNKLLDLLFISSIVYTNKSSL